MSCALRRCTVVLWLATILATVPCRADGLDPAQALVLFKQGRTALGNRDYEAAWTAFDESSRLDPRVGTLLNLADCEEHLGRLARAYAHWQQAIDRARLDGDKRLDFLSQRLAALDPRVPRLKITRGSATPASATIRRDQTDVGDASVGQEIPVDPGHHEIEVSADGFATKRYAVDLDEGGRASIEVELDAPAPRVVAAPAPVPREAPASATPAPFWTTQRTVALACGAVGAAGIAVGVVSGITAFAKKNDALGTAGCTSTGACESPGAVSQWSSARVQAGTAATVSTAGSIVGGVALATGAILWLTARSKHPGAGIHAGLGFGARSVELSGRW